MYMYVYINLLSLLLCVCLSFFPFFPTEYDAHIYLRVNIFYMMRSGEKVVECLAALHRGEGSYCTVLSGYCTIRGDLRNEIY